MPSKTRRRKSFRKRGGVNFLSRISNMFSRNARAEEVPPPIKTPSLKKAPSLKKSSSLKKAPSLKKMNPAGLVEGKIYAIENRHRKKIEVGTFQRYYKDTDGQHYQYSDVYIFRLLNGVTEKYSGYNPESFTLATPDQEKTFIAEKEAEKEAKSSARAAAKARSAARSAAKASKR